MQNFLIIAVPIVTGLVWLCYHHPELGRKLIYIGIVTALLAMIWSLTRNFSTGQERISNMRKTDSVFINVEQQLRDSISFLEKKIDSAKLIQVGVIIEKNELLRQVQDKIEKSIDQHSREYREWEDLIFNCIIAAIFILAALLLLVPEFEAIQKKKARNVSK